MGETISPKQCSPHGLPSSETGGGIRSFPLPETSNYFFLFFGSGAAFHANGVREGMSLIHWGSQERGSSNEAVRRAYNNTPCFTVPYNRRNSS